MKKIQFQIQNSSAAVDFLASLVLKVGTALPSAYFYLGNICSYSKYDGNSPRDIAKRQEWIDFNAQTNFQHFRQLRLAELLDYLHQCQAIEDCHLICSDRPYSVEQLYHHLSQETAFICSLALMEGELYQVIFDPDRLEQAFFAQYKVQYLRDII